MFDSVQTEPCVGLIIERCKAHLSHRWHYLESF